MAEEVQTADHHREEEEGAGEEGGRERPRVDTEESEEEGAEVLLLLQVARVGVSLLPTVEAADIRRRGGSGLHYHRLDLLLGQALSQVLGQAEDLS